MIGMFYNCAQLKSLPDISKWNVSNVVDISTLFCQCSSLLSLPDISNGIRRMLKKCQSYFLIVQL